MKLKMLCFLEVSSSIIDELYKIDSLLWNRFILEYFDWIYNRGFNFDYCDVLIGHIFKAYELTNELNVKSNGALTGAKLGRRHNRWHVMRYVIRMCNNNISDLLANRISIEIHVGGHPVKYDFKACVEQLSLKVDSYHTRIQEAL